VSPAKSSILLSSDLTIETWRVAVEDEGPGVPESQRERIFERFVRLDPGAKRPTRGSGLGLTISRSILGLHRGTIRAEAARQGTGLRVVFEIPIAEINDRPAPEPSPAAAAHP
jgi:signal transduction histidine kinase